MLGAPPEPHAKFVQIDQRATQAFMNYMILTNFGAKRVGWLLGRWVTDSASGEEGVQVHAIYEPKQDAPPTPSTSPTTPRARSASRSSARGCSSRASA